MKPAGALTRAKRDAKSGKQYLPLSKSTFSNYIEDNCIYVDKTRYKNFARHLSCIFGDIGQNPPPIFSHEGTQRGTKKKTVSKPPR
jgi:hypothetical protein